MRETILEIIFSMRYDVFISSKSEDYPLAKEIHDFLTANGMKVFFAETDIPYVGDSDYKNTIDEAIDCSENLIVVASKEEYLTAPWVKYEWDLFANEKLAGRKSGNLLTIVDDSIKIKELPIGLRRYQCLFISNYKKSVCPFLGRETPASVSVGPDESDQPSDGASKWSKWGLYACLCILSAVLALVIGIIINEYRKSDSPDQDLPVVDTLITPDHQKEQSETQMGSESTKADTGKQAEADINPIVEPEVKPAPSKPRPILIEKGSTRTITANGTSFDMLLVEGGKLTMGTAHVRLNDYYIGKHEVTQGLWKAVMGENPSSFQLGSGHPVETVSWNDCQKFITRLNELTGLKFMFPTEAQWEFAARGGNKGGNTKFSGGDNIGLIGWYELNSNGKTHKTGTLDPNELGLYDMTGNVQEWCMDFYGDYPAGNLTDPTGPSDGTYKVIRGSCYYNREADSGITVRNKSSMGDFNDYTGLRLAMKK